MDHSPAPASHLPPHPTRRPTPEKGDWVRTRDDDVGEVTEVLTYTVRLRLRDGYRYIKTRNVVVIAPPDDEQPEEAAVPEPQATVEVPTNYQVRRDALELAIRSDGRANWTAHYEPTVVVDDKRIQRTIGYYLDRAAEFERYLRGERSSREDT